MRCRLVRALCVALAACALTSTCAQEGTESVLRPATASNASAGGNAEPVQIDLASGLVALATPMAVKASGDNSPSQFTLTPSDTTGVKSLAVHFSALTLVAGDKLVVRGQKNENYTITTSQTGGFWTRPVAGNYVVVELVPSATSTAAARTASGFAVAVDGYKTMRSAQQEENCGADDSRPAKCFISDAPKDVQMYLKAQAVARVLINGSVPCSGAILGSGAYFLTAAHCIRTAAAAREAIIEFGAETAECADDSKIQMGAMGTDVVRNSELYAVNVALDYAILKLQDPTLVSKFGFLTLRAAGATAGEALFVPHHPNAYAKRISATNNNAAITAQVGTAKTACSGSVADQVAYVADTVGGSSGAPVVSALDYTIVAVHRCGGCVAVGSNSGVNAKAIAADLKQQGKDRPEFYSA